MFDQLKANVICARLAEGESLRSVCRDDGMPSEAAVRAWALDDVADFAAQYARARELGYEAQAERIIELSDECRIGKKVTRKANGDVEEIEGDMVERSRLQIDARKWILAKMLPKKYGDKLDLNHSGGVKFERIEAVVVDSAG